MMELSTSTIKLAILFLPGFISATIAFALISKKKTDNRGYFVSVFLLSFFAYFLQNVLLNLIEVFKNSFKFEKWLSPSFINSILEDSDRISYKEIFFTCIIAIIIGLLIARIQHSKILYKISRSLKLTNKTTNLDVWHTLFDDSGKGIGDWVYIIDKELDLVYGGFVEDYSQDHSNMELLLRDAVCYKNSNRKKRLRKMNKVYIAKDEKDIIIEVRSEFEDE